MVPVLAVVRRHETAEDTSLNNNGGHLKYGRQNITKNVLSTALSQASA